MAAATAQARGGSHLWGWAMFGMIGKAKKKAKAKQAKLERDYNDSVKTPIRIASIDPVKAREMVHAGRPGGAQAEFLQQRTRAGFLDRGGAPTNQQNAGIGSGMLASADAGKVYGGNVPAYLNREKFDWKSQR